MRNVPAISEVEYQAMKIIWAADEPIGTNDVIEKFEQTTEWKPMTIRKLLSRLVKKEALKYEKNGRAFVCLSLIQESEIPEIENDSFVNRFFGGALDSMIVNLFECDKLSENDIKRLK